MVEFFGVVDSEGRTVVSPSYSLETVKHILSFLKDYGKDSQYGVVKNKRPS